MATGEMSVMGKSGDTKITWDPSDTASVNSARAEFNDLRKKGFQAFSVDPKGDKGEQLSEFDPKAEKIIMVPALRGGC